MDVNDGERCKEDAAGSMRDKTRQVDAVVSWLSRRQSTSRGAAVRGASPHRWMLRHCSTCHFARESRATSRLCAKYLAAAVIRGEDPFVVHATSSTRYAHRHSDV